MARGSYEDMQKMGGVRHLGTKKSAEIQVNRKKKNSSPTFSVFFSSCLKCAVRISDDACSALPIGNRPCVVTKTPIIKHTDEIEVAHIYTIHHIMHFYADLLFISLHAFGKHRTKECFNPTFTSVTLDKIKARYIVCP